MRHADGHLSSIAHTYRYLQPSSLERSGTPRLSLETSGNGDDAHPHFFQGTLHQPRLVAELLTAVHLIVGSRFFTPPNSVALAVALADPVVTSGGGMLRFEGFSGCCSAYIRVDLLPGIYDGAVVGKGTTNVDFNAGMRAALAAVRDGDGLELAVGRDEVRLRTRSAEVTERKVALPARWLRGMVEVQSYQAGMQPRFAASAMEALRFLRMLPKASTRRTPLWVNRVGAALAASTRPSPGAVRLTEAARLRPLQALLPRAIELRVHADEAQQASTWVLDFGNARLSLVLSSEVWRGFSGEGQALSALMRAAQGDGGVLARVRAALSWQGALEPASLATQLGCGEQSVADALRVLGASGLVGFDVHEGRYFHRVLPFDLSMMEDMHPRLADALALLEEQAVTVTRTSPFEASVASGGVAHRLRELDGQLHCTCPWFARHQGQRGPCKHALAASALRPPHD
jgi:hypothetical protein